MISRANSLLSDLRAEGGRGPIQGLGHGCWPRDDSGSPACERPLDRTSLYAPSSTIAPPAYGPLLLWPRRGASGPSDARTRGPDLCLLGRHCWPLPPEDDVKTGFLVC